MLWVLLFVAVVAAIGGYKIFSSGGGGGSSSTCIFPLQPGKYYRPRSATSIFALRVYGSETFDPKTKSIGQMEYRAKGLAADVRVNAKWDKDELVIDFVGKVGKAGQPQFPVTGNHRISCTGENAFVECSEEYYNSFA